MPIKSLGRLVATRDANGHVNEIRYNAAGAVLAEIHADGGIKRHGYDVFGDQIRTTDELATTRAYRNAYRLTDTYQESGQTVASVGTNAPQGGRVTRQFNANDELTGWVDERDANRNRFFAHSAQGQALTVVQGDVGSNVPGAFAEALARMGNEARAQHFFFANGQSIGSFGQLVDGSGAFKANFDVNYTAVSDHYPAVTPGEVIAQTGDTLRTLAGRVFGDASLWYVIAEENGLTAADEALPVGLAVRIPNRVLSLSNTSSSFKPFDVSEALGDTTPTQPAPPAPKKKGCGVVGQILVVAVAIVATVFTAGVAGGAAGSFTAIMQTGATALTGGAVGGLGAVGASIVGGAVGSAVSQAVGIAAGVQEGFEWKGVALGAIGAGVTAGLGGSVGWDTFTSAFGRAAGAVNAAGNAMLTQGIGVATGLQSSFSWREVALSAAAAPAAQTAGTGASALFGSGNVGEFASRFSAGISGSLVRRALGGTVDTATAVADAFGNVLGNSIVDRMVGPPTVTTRSGARDDGATSGETVAANAIAGAGGTAALSNNPTESIYQPGTVLTPDEVRVVEAGNPSSIEGVLVAAPTWKPGEERIYQQLINSSIFGWGNARDEDRAAARAQSIYNHDIRLQNQVGNPLPAIAKAIGNQLIQPVLQVADLGLAGRGLVQNKISDWTGGRVPAFDAASYYVSDVGRMAASGGGIAETLPLGLQSSTLGSVGFYSSRTITNIMDGDFRAAVWDAGAVGLNFIGAQGVSSAPTLLRQIDLVGASGGPRLANQQGMLNVDAFAPSSSSSYPEGLAYRIDLPAHLAGPDGFKAGRLHGTHNVDNALAALEGRGASYTVIKTGTPGISELEYSAFDPARGKYVSGTKTVYDPRVISDERILDMSLSAGQRGFELYRSTPSQMVFTVPQNGVNFRVYINIDPATGAPYVGNIHPVR